MRQVASMAAMCALAAAANAETVKGELSFNSKGIGKISECKTGRVLTLGDMTSTQYHDLIETYWRLSFHGKTPVLIRVRGDVTRKGPPGTELRLESPNIVELNGGRCGESY